MLIIFPVLVIMNASAGIFLAELFYDQADAEIPIESSNNSGLLPTLTLLSGMIIAGFPEKNADWCFWSNYLKAVGIKLFGLSSELSRSWSSIGTSMMLVGLLYLPTAQAFLSHPGLVWMGKVSFSVFLIHSMLIRSVFCWMLYANSVPLETVDEDWNLHISKLLPATGINLLFTYAIFFPLLYLSAHFWTNYVESRCTDLARWVEDRMAGNGQPDMVVLLPK